MKLLLLSLVTSIFAAQAHAAEPMRAQPSTCDMKFSVHIESYLVFSRGSGTGVVACRDSRGKLNAKHAVDIEVGGIGLGLGVFDMDGVAGNIGILEPKDVTGTYLVANANVAVGAGVGLGLGFVGQQNGLSFEGNLSAGLGVGVEVNGQTWTITLHK